jgi:hypothetical protein
MDLSLTKWLFGLALLLTALTLPAVRWPPAPATRMAWLPWHHLCLTGLAGVMLFGLHWLRLALA